HPLSFHIRSPPTSTLFPYTTLFRSNVKLIPRFASGLVVLAGAQAVVGWSLGFATLRQVLSGLPPMMPNTAVALVLAGVSLWFARSEEHTSELQSRFDLVCRLLLEKK